MVKVTNSMTSLHKHVHISFLLPGSAYILKALNYCGCSCVCIKPHIESDFIIGAWGFFIIALATVAVTAYNLARNYLNPTMYLSVGAAVIFSFGSYGIVHTSYSENFDQAVLWTCLACGCCCGPPEGIKGDEGPLSADELRPLTNPELGAGNSDRRVRMCRQWTHGWMMVDAV